MTGNSAVGIETTTTQKGQVTLPAEIRARLGLKPRDHVRFEVDGDAMRIKPAPSRIARHFGVVSAPGPALDSRQERDLFEEGVAREASTEGR